MPPILASHAEFNGVPYSVIWGLVVAIVLFTVCIVVSLLSQKKAVAIVFAGIAMVTAIALTLITLWDPPYTGNDFILGLSILIFPIGLLIRGLRLNGDEKLGV